MVSTPRQFTALDAGCVQAPSSPTLSMRTRLLGRLQTLTALASLTSGRSRGWRRWVVTGAAGATADGLRTRHTGSTRRESGRWPSEAESEVDAGAPPNPPLGGFALSLKSGDPVAELGGKVPAVFGDHPGWEDTRK